MLHHNHETEKPTVKYPTHAQTVLQFSTKDLKSAIKFLKDNQIELLFNKPKEGGIGSYVVFKDPDGNHIELIEIK